MRSANFELFTDAGERTGRDILRQFERVHSFFLLVYDVGAANAKPVRLIAFRSEKEYAPYRPNEVAAAFFQPGDDHDYIVMTAGVTDQRGVAVHEYTHLMVQQSGRAIPLWFNEGLAELYSNLQPQGSDILVGRPIPGRVREMMQDPWIDVAHLVSVRHDSAVYNEKNQAGAFYGESWLLVHMLNLDKGYRPHLAAFMAALKENNEGEAFQKAYGKSVEDIDRDLKAYLHSSTINAAILPVQLPKDVDAPAVETGASLHARLALAELLSDVPAKRAQSQESYEQLAHDYPAKWEIEAGWAHYFWRERMAPESAAHYAKALEMGCKDAPVYVAYGRVLNVAGREKDAVPVLRKALSLDAGSQLARLELGIALVRTGEAREAIAELNKVAKVTGEEAPRYFYHLAYAYYRTDDIPHARAALEKGRPYVKMPQDRTSYASLTEGMKAREAALAAAAVRQEKLARGEPAAAAPSFEPSPPARAATTETSAGGQPKLVRRQLVTNPDGTTSVVPHSFSSAEGQLTQFDCKGKTGVLHVLVNGADTLFTIEDPLKVIVRSGNGAPVDFRCGPQKPQRLKVEFEESRDAAGKVLRAVRTLDFE